ncbi:MAG: RNA 2',3'-cyclic phosphodiesterase [Alphaproteobacteria bacterium]|nr:RNA 2',3'-cyclic phosphodiesterase [Alphaproteobacteria bacterium]MDP6516138.1 RNA 2',3'-cyclic phosphodiesterase [Alphaproteobacteria bacterium]
MHRLFVAIPLPEPVKDRLEQFQAGLAGARWVPRENMHLTLRFIGAVAGDQAEDIDTELATVRAPPFPVTLEGAGTFPGRGKPRSLWAGVAANGALAELKGRVDRALARAGCEPDQRKYTAHVTLARLKGTRRESVADFAARAAPAIPIGFDVATFVLYSSFLASSGAIYTPEATYPLAGP